MAAAAAAARYIPQTTGDDNFSCIVAFVNLTIFYKGK